MKKFVVLAGVALLAACGSQQEAAAPEAAASDAAPAAPAAAAPATGPTPGSYDVTTPEGGKEVTTLMADSTYVTRDAGDKVIDKGKWAMKDGKTCFMPETGGENCFTDSAPAADGSFTATDAEGKVTQVKPHAK